MYDASKQIIKSSLLEKDPGMTSAEMRKKFFLRFYEAEFSEEQILKILETFK
jgi:hypothetical protein